MVKEEFFPTGDSDVKIAIKCDVQSVLSVRISILCRDGVLHDVCHMSVYEPVTSVPSSDRIRQRIWHLCTDLRQTNHARSFISSTTLFRPIPAMTFKGTRRCHVLRGLVPSKYLSKSTLAGERGDAQTKDESDRASDPRARSSTSSFKVHARWKGKSTYQTCLPGSPSDTKRHLTIQHSTISGE